MTPTTSTVTGSSATRSPRGRIAVALVGGGVVLAAAVVLVLVLTGGDGGPPGAQPSDPAPSTATPSAAPAPPPLIGPAPSAAASQPADTSLGTPVRARYVSFLDAALPDTAKGQQLGLAFFDDAHFVGTVDRIERQPLLTSWSGALGTPRSSFVVTLAGGRYQVTASTAQGVFTMSMTPAGFYQVVEVGAPPAVIDEGPATPSTDP